MTRRDRCIRRVRGFTLIELLVVIAIIGLLASIILASLNTARVKARDAQRLSDMHQIQTALEFYDLACGSFPTASAALNAGQPPTAASSGLQIGDHNGCPAGTTLATFIPSLPADPRSGYPYLYTAFGTGTSCTTYHLGADLELAQSPGSKFGPSGNAKCTFGNYIGNSGGYSSTNEIATTGGDFSPGGTAGAWVFDVTP